MTHVVTEACIRCRGLSTPDADEWGKIKNKMDPLDERADNEK